MTAALRTSAMLLASLTLLTGVVYPVVVTAVAQVLFPVQANGSLIIKNGKPLGSALVGQPFRKAGYFWGRPSGTSPTPYNAASSGGSNLGPLNPALRKNVESRLEELRRDDPSLTKVTVDLVTASGSGLDPHISPESAGLQTHRVAAARGKTDNEIRELVSRFTEGRQWGLFGEPRVNVLMLNLALDDLDVHPDAPEAEAASRP